MNGEINELLGEISKFKTNIANSNSLMDLLSKTIKDISDLEKKLADEHEQLISEFRETGLEIKASLDNLENITQENKDSLKELRELPQKLIEVDKKLTDATMVVEENKISLQNLNEIRNDLNNMGVAIKDNQSSITALKLVCDKNEGKLKKVFWMLVGLLVISVLILLISVIV